MQKKTTLQAPVAGPVPLGQVPPGKVGGKLYRAAKPFSKMSLPGRPPVPWFQAQLETSMGSLEPPPVNVVPVLGPWEAHDTALAPVVLNAVEQSLPTTWWQTRSQSSGAPAVAWSVIALPSSSNAPVAFTACVGTAKNTNSSPAEKMAQSREPNHRLLPRPPPPPPAPVRLGSRPFDRPNPLSNFRSPSQTTQPQAPSHPPTTPR